MRVRPPCDSGRGDDPDIEDEDDDEEGESLAPLFSLPHYRKTVSWDGGAGIKLDIPLHYAHDVQRGEHQERKPSKLNSPNINFALFCSNKRFHTEIQRTDDRTCERRKVQTPATQLRYLL